MSTREYDDDGNVVVEVTTVEPEWDDESRAYAVALLAYEADTCPNCRAPLHETTAAENEGRYRADLPMRCHKCTAISERSEGYRDTAHSHALLFPVTFTPPPPPPPADVSGGDM